MLLVGFVYFLLSLIGLISLILICKGIRKAAAAPRLTASFAAVVALPGYVAWGWVTDDSTRPENIALTMGLPIPATAENCHAGCSSSIEDTFLYFRCDVAPTDTPAIIESATWNTPVTFTGTEKVEAPWHNSFDKPWWQPGTATTWIQVPRGQAGISGRHQPGVKEEIYKLLFIDTSAPDRHRVYMTYEVP
jgi:hypothetical protein